MKKEQTQALVFPLTTPLLSFTLGRKGGEPASGKGKASTAPDEAVTAAAGKGKGAGGGKGKGKTGKAGGGGAGELTAKEAKSRRKAEKAAMEAARKNEVESMMKVTHTYTQHATPFFIVFFLIQFF